MNVSISFLIICVVIVVVIASIVSWLFVYKKEYMKLKLSMTKERIWRIRQMN